MYDTLINNIQLILNSFIYVNINKTWTILKCFVLMFVCTQTCARAPVCMEQTKLAVCGQWRESETLLSWWGMCAYDKRKGFAAETTILFKRISFERKPTRQVRNTAARFRS
jgi:hypothetical protein